MSGYQLEGTLAFPNNMGAEMVAIDADGRGIRKITLEGAGSGTSNFGKSQIPQFVDGSDRIYFYDGTALFSIHQDGSDRINLLSVKGPKAHFSPKPFPAADIKVSPDGRYALAIAGYAAYVVTIPPANGDTPDVIVMSPQVPVKKITDMGADEIFWSSDGSRINWTAGSTIYSRPFDPAIFFIVEEEEDEEQEEEEKDEEASEESSEDADMEGEESESMEGSEADDEQAGEEEPEDYKFLEQEDAVSSYKVTVTVPRDVPVGTLLLSGARVLTMSGAGVIESGDILIENNRIMAVGPTGTLDVPEGADFMDMSGKTISPGFVDAHAHWAFSLQSDMLSMQNWALTTNLAYGVTSGLDVQTSGTNMFIYQDMVDAGEILGPLAWSTGSGVFMNANIESKKDAVGILKWYKDHYRTSNIKAYVSGTRRQRQFIIEASAEVGIMPTTEGAIDMKLDITHMIDGMAGNEHAYPTTPIANDVIQLSVITGISYVPTLLVLYGGPGAEAYYHINYNSHDSEKIHNFIPHSIVDAVVTRWRWTHESQRQFDDTAREAAKLWRAGAKVGIGSHGQWQGLGYHYEMWALATGMTPLEAMEIATIGGAQTIGRQDEIGSIEPGKFADLVIFDDNPLDDIHNSLNMSHVMKNGRLYEDDNLDEVWPRQQTREKAWFVNDRPERTSR